MLCHVQKYIIVWGTLFGIMSQKLHQNFKSMYKAYFKSIITVDNMARVRRLGKYHNTIEILDSRLSCDCEYIKEKIEKHLRYEFFERISGRGNNEKICTITEANREEFEDDLKYS